MLLDHLVSIPEKLTVATLSLSLHQKICGQSISDSAKSINMLSLECFVLHCI